MFIDELSVDTAELAQLVIFCSVFSDWRLPVRVTGSEVAVVSAARCACSSSESGIA